MQVTAADVKDALESIMEHLNVQYVQHLESALEQLNANQEITSATTSHQLRTRIINAIGEGIWLDESEPMA